MKLLPSPPRRFRRPLLLPVGWVGLGFLLLLGCLVLRAHWRQLRPENMLQVTMPPLKADTSLAAFYRTHGRGRKSSDYSPWVDIDDKNASAKINHMRPWRTIEFGGQPLADFVNSQVIEGAIRLIQADSSHAGGVRIYFRPSTTYANLVAVLDIMLFTDQKKYWLDIQHQPMTLYAITEKELPLGPARVLPFSDTWHRVAPSSPITWQQWLASHWLPTWRLPLLLLLTMTCLSTYHFIRIIRSQPRQPKL